MFCPNCGAPNPDDARFCGNCGASLAEPQEEIPAEPLSSPEPARLAGPQTGQPERRERADEPRPSFSQPSFRQPVQPSFQQPVRQPVQPPVQPPVRQPQAAPNPGCARNAGGAPQPTYAQMHADNRRTYSILSYIGILWLFGLFGEPEKDDLLVRFHVGQGIIASIAVAVCSLIAALLSALCFAALRTETTVFGRGTGIYTVSPAAGVISLILWLAVAAVGIFYLVYGVVGVSQGRNRYLPVIGRLAFYK